MSKKTLQILSLYNFLISRMPNSSSKSKLGWEPQEQALIRDLRQEKFIKSWKQISRVLADNFPGKTRTAKQCRERYTNFIKLQAAGAKRNSWAPQDDQQLFANFFKFGSKWSKLVQKMPGRSENNLKNRYYGLMRKICRKIKNTEAILKIKQKKPIKIEMLTKILQASIEIASLVSKKEKVDDGYSRVVLSIKDQLLKLIKDQEREPKISEIKDLIYNIHQFNFFRRSNPIALVLHKAKILEQETKQSKQNKNLGQIVIMRMKEPLDIFQPQDEVIRMQCDKNKRQIQLIEFEDLNPNNHRRDLSEELCLLLNESCMPEENLFNILL